ncbi:MAG TPA: hypothetical protein VM344_07770 [Vitreimonas sp.]|jgi:hypothetical protein|nr:hypothetical protein [Vitreimonas sp.]
MSTNLDFDRIAQAWLADGPVELSDRVLAAVLDDVHETRQRRASRVPRRLSTMTSTLKVLAAAAIVIVALAAGSLFLNRGSTPPVGASPSPSVPATPAATPSPSFEFLPARGGIAAGTYRTDQIRPTTDITLPCCFEVVYHDARFAILSERGLDRHLIFSNPAFIIDHTTGKQATVPADFAGWLAAHPWLDTAAPADIVVDGVPGRAVEGEPRTDAPFDAEGVIRLTASSALPGIALVAGERFRIVEVDGPEGILAIAIITRADRWEAFRPTAEAALESLRFVE